MSSKVHKNEMTSSKRIQNREDNMELKGCVGSHVEAQVVLQFGGIQVHTWLSHVGLSTLACTCSDQQIGINQSAFKKRLHRK